MRTVTSPGIIYRMINYSDKSAIAFSFMRDYGKVKLFMNKVYSKKGGVLKFIPGDINFHKKSETDLHKYYGFQQHVSHYHFLDVPDIYLRVHLLFEIYDALNGTEQPDPFFWKLLMKFNEENVHKAMVYMVYHLINSAGLMFDPFHCIGCGAEFSEGQLGKDGLYCNLCCGSKTTVVDEFQTKILKILTDTAAYKTIDITRGLEMSLLGIFVQFLEWSNSTKIKGLDILETLV